jgi:stearoyl-CoA desaturase (delta-9 desaturase)
MPFGLIDLPWWGYIFITLVFTHFTIAGVTIYLHRCQAHRGLVLHPVISHFFRFWLWLTTGMETKQWVAVHRKHHARCETEDDPHSPQILGIGKVLREGAELYRAESVKQETLDKFGLGTPDDWMERNVYRRHSGKGIALMLLIDVLLMGPLGLTVWAIQMMWIPIFAAGVINGLGHWWGYRNYECADASTNISPWGLLIGGEELHNNHHAFPSSAKFSAKPWEFDLGWLYIRTFELLGLARVKKVAPTPVIDPAKQGVDMDTLRAVIINRMHVMADYSHNVLLNVLKDEVRKADTSCRALFSKAGGLLVRELTLLDEKAKSRLDKVLSASQSLKTVYQHRLRLQNVWERSATTHENLLRALQEWCSQAEASGIKSLKDFAQSLRGYTLQTA